MSAAGTVGRCLRERDGRFASFIKPAPYGTAQPFLVLPPAAEIPSENIGKEAYLHVNASLSDRLPRNP